MNSDARPDSEPTAQDVAPHSAVRGTVIKWAIVLASALVFAFIPVPEGVTPQSWRLLAIFVATIIGSIVRPVPAAAVVLMGVAAIALFQVLPVGQALGGYAHPIVWLGVPA